MNSVVEYSNYEKNNIDFNISKVAITDIIEDLQSNIKGLTDAKNIELGYGKISSSLKFKTDKEKFQNLIKLLIKFTAGLAKEEKIYLSAYPDGRDKFIISIKDDYSHSSKHLLEFYKKAFLHENFDPRKFGISKLSLRLARAILSTLNGKAEISVEDNSEEMFFVFPMEFSQAQKAEQIQDENQEDKIEQAIEELKEESVDKDENIEEGSRDITVIDETREYEMEEDRDLIDETEINGETIEDELKEENVDALDTTPGSDETLNKLDLSQLRCLYIEDQVDSQILFKVQMKNLKEIKFAVSFEEAMPILDSDKFDFIVMDINLQGEYNGLDALKLIQRMPNYENVPIIAVTAYVLPGDKEKFIATGFSGFISKPLFREKMVDTLKKIIPAKA